MLCYYDSSTRSTVYILPVSHTPLRPTRISFRVIVNRGEKSEKYQTLSERKEELALLSFLWENHLKQTEPQILASAADFHLRFLSLTSFEPLKMFETIAVCEAVQEGSSSVYIVSKQLKNYVRSLYDTK